MFRRTLVRNCSLSPCGWSAPQAKQTRCGRGAGAAEVGHSALIPFKPCMVRVLLRDGMPDTCDSRYVGCGQETRAAVPAGMGASRSGSGFARLVLAHAVAAAAGPVEAAAWPRPCGICGMDAGTFDDHAGSPADQPFDGPAAPRAGLDRFRRHALKSIKAVFALLALILVSRHIQL
jgi:hypothetical protein